MGSLLRMANLGVPSSQRSVGDEVRDYVLDSVTPMGGIFAGSKALGALQHKRDFAKYLLKGGMGSEKVRSKTGWFPGAGDSKMRFEINDSKARFPQGVVLLKEYEQLGRYLKKQRRDIYVKYRDRVLSEDVNTTSEVLAEVRKRFGGNSDVAHLNATESNMSVLRNQLGAKPGEVLKVGDVLEHKELFDNYPQLAEMELNPTSGGNTLGAYYTKTHPSGAERKVVDLDADVSKDPMGTMIHELQHGVQEIEGFPRGASPESYLDLKDAIKYENELANEYLKDKGYALVAGSHPQTTEYGVYNAKKWDGLNTPNIPDEELPPDILERLEALRELAKEDMATVFDQSQRTPFGRYQNTAGEYEARQAELRRALEIGTPGGSKFSPPWQHKPKYLIKKYHGE